MTADADQGTDARAEGGNEVVCQKCEGEMVFQPELFDPDRGQYVCGCGHRSGRVFVSEKQPAGVAAQQTAEKASNDDSITPESGKWYRVKCIVRLSENSEIELTGSYVVRAEHEEEARRKAESHPKCVRALKGPFAVEENQHNWSWDVVIE